MNSELLSKIKESLSSILPITIVILILNFIFVRMPIGTVVLFLVGAVILVIGMGTFTVGADLALMPLGEELGTKITASRKIWLLIISAFVLGFVITIAEPDLQVLAKQVPSIPNLHLLISVSVSVGVFLVIAILRILLQIRLSYLVIGLYGIVFLVAFLSKSDYMSVAFDSGGVTTGPVTVPFILALGSGVSAARGGGDTAESDSFGLCGICSVGPMIAILILGLFHDSSGMGHAVEIVHEVNSFGELVSLYLNGFKLFSKEVFAALLPISIVFLIFQVTYLKFPKRKLLEMLIGMIFTFLGLTLFLTGVNVGFMPAGTYLGGAIASLSYNWILIPISMIMGFFVIAAEPAVYALNKQIEEITSGAISKKMMMIGLSAGVGIALALAMIRIMTGISIWYFLLPGYIIALALSFFVPQLFTALALDSGGVASGAMAAAFLLPFALGACEAVGGNVMTDAFGIVAMIAMMPIISVQIVGLVYQIKLNKIEKNVTEYEGSEEVIDLEIDEDDIDDIEL